MTQADPANSIPAPGAQRVDQGLRDDLMGVAAIEKLESLHAELSAFITRLKREPAAGHEPSSSDEGNAQKETETMNAHVRPSDVAQSAFDDDWCWNIDAIAERAEALADDTIKQLSNLFHCARMAANPLRAEFDRLEAEAKRLYPPYPADLVRGAAPEDMTMRQLEAQEICRRQRSLIAVGIGLTAATDAYERADDLKTHLAERVAKIPARTPAEAAEKFAVIFDNYFEPAAPFVEFDLSSFRQELIAIAEPK